MLILGVVVHSVSTNTEAIDGQYIYINIYIYIHIYIHTYIYIFICTQRTRSDRLGSLALSLTTAMYTLRATTYHIVQVKIHVAPISFSKCDLPRTVQINILSFSPLANRWSTSRNDLVTLVVARRSRTRISGQE